MRLTLLLRQRNQQMQDHENQQLKDHVKITLWEAMYIPGTKGAQGEENKKRFYLTVSIYSLVLLVFFFISFLPYMNNL